MPRQIISAKPIAAMIAAVAVAGATGASAQGFLDFFFGGSRRPPPPPPQYYAPNFPTPDPFRSLFGGNGPQVSPRTSERVHGPAARGTAYCVRLCDGRYFPIPAQHNVSAGEQCRAVCPATATQIYVGSGIDDATTRDGKRYSDLPNAFVYRQRIVAGCSCNGRTNFSVAHIPIGKDPTLRRGDIVAAASGFEVYAGHDRHHRAEFKPIGSTHVPKRIRRRLAGVKIAPRVAEKAPSAPVETTGAASDDDSRLSRRER